MSNAMTSIITADEGVLYTSHRKISPDYLIKQWMKAETLLSIMKLLVDNYSILVEMQLWQFYVWNYQ